jgi:hypothetical protein
MFRSLNGIMRVIVVAGGLAKGTKTTTHAVQILTVRQHPAPGT